MSNCAARLWELVDYRQPSREYVFVYSRAGWARKEHSRPPWTQSQLLKVSVCDKAKHTCHMWHWLVGRNRTEHETEHRLPRTNSVTTGSLWQGKICVTWYIGWPVIGSVGLQKKKAVFEEWPGSCLSSLCLLTIHSVHAVSILPNPELNYCVIPSDTRLSSGGQTW